jgi:hypothetical protein
MGKIGGVTPRLMQKRERAGTLAQLHDLCNPGLREAMGLRRPLCLQRLMESMLVHTKVLRIPLALNFGRGHFIIAGIIILSR